MKKLILSTLSILFFASVGLAQSQETGFKTTKTKKIVIHKKKQKKKSHATKQKPVQKSIAKKQATSSDSSMQSTPKTSSTENVDQQFSTLGDNQVFIDRVKNMDDDRKVRIVQNRTVDLDNRLEIAGNYGMVGGGDSYLDSHDFGGLVEYHFNPHWSIGARYERYLSTLTSEGKNQAANAQAAGVGSGAIYSGTDAPQSSEMLTASYSPIYGKLNLFDLGVSHFDIYTMIGYGKMQVLSGSSDTMAAGGGVALWLSQHFAARLEVRYQTYKDLLSPAYGSTNRRENTVQGMASIGVLL